MKFIGANRLLKLEEGVYDGHAHVFRHDLPMVPNRRYTPDYDAGLEDYVELLKSNGLDGGLLVQPSFLGTDNSFLVESLQRAVEFPELKFKGVAVVEPDTDIEELKRLDEAGIVGLRLNIIKHEDAFDVEPWHSVLQTADRLGWHVELHARGPYLPIIIPKLLAACHTVVIDHFGLPDTSVNDECTGFKAIATAPNGRLLVKISAPYRIKNYSAEENPTKFLKPNVDKLVDTIGSENLVWGSDWPHTQHEKHFSFTQSLEYCRPS